ncbi:MAG: hypothetical protein K6G49_02630 [Candidatus Saccharibacteria bacterium]|nr:hypothetical protein [Candidatus Saccharibacteria bacterium]
MLTYNSKLIGTPILSVQAGGAIASIVAPVVNPDNLKILAFKLQGPIVNAANNILDVKSVREYSPLGLVIDDNDELIGPEDVVKIKEVLDLNFDLIGLKVETKKGSKLGKIIDFSLTSEDFTIQQIIVKRPTIKSFMDPELTIHRREIVEVTDYKVIVKDEEKVIKARAAKEDFVPNFVNPFRTHEPGFAPADTKTPADKDN